MMKAISTRLKLSRGILPALVIGAGLLGGCSRPEPAPSPNVLAKVGSIEITVEEFKQEMKFRQEGNKPVKSKEALLQEMITQKSLLLRARAAGLETNAEIKRSYENILIGRLKQQELEARLKSAQISNDDVKKKYEETISSYTRPGKSHLAILMLRLPTVANEKKAGELKAQLTDARQKALDLPAGTPGFGALAIENSEDDGSRYRGGDIGWFDDGEKSRWPDEVVQTGAKLQVGNISEVIRTEKAFFVVKKVDQRGSGVTLLNEVAESIRRRLLSEKRQDLEKTFLAETRRSQTIETNQTLLQSIPFSNQVLAGKETVPPAMP